MSLTTDPADPRLGHGVDAVPVPQHDVYLVLSAEERAKGFTRPFRDKYIHVGPPGPVHPLRALTDEERERYAECCYVGFEDYPQPRPDGSSIVGRYWTQAQLDAAGKGCGTETVMGYELSATYARNPRFYGSTYCCGCSRHLPVAEFTWSTDGQRVGS